MTFAILIIYFGSGKYAQFDVERFNNMSECLVAKSAIVAQYADTWTPIDPDNVICRPLTTNQ